MQISANQPQFVDDPACYLEGGCGFSFADGHGEIHRWQTSALRIPVQFGVYSELMNTYPANGANNADWQWLIQHATSH